MGLAVGLLSLAACGAPAPGPWSRFDLAAHEPRVLASPYQNPAKTVFRPATFFLGAREVRDLARVPPETFAGIPHQSAGQVRGIEQVAGSRLAWSVAVGREAYLSFTPLLDERAPCRCTFRVVVSDQGQEHEIARVAPEAAPRLAPAAVRADLSPWQGRTISLQLEVAPGKGDPRGASSPWVRWASPAVYGRGDEPAKARRQPLNVLLVGIDTLRADHVGAYRGERGIAYAGPSLTPALDRLAGESDLYLEAFSVFNVTNPSFASILTGLYGKNHGVYDLKTPLPETHTTLAEVFRGAGYDTLAVVSAHHLGAHNSGLGQGFETFFLADEHAAAELAVETAMDWLGGRERPFFAWVHLFDPHTPHTPPEPFAGGLRPESDAGLGPVASWFRFRPEGPREYDQPVLAGNRALYAGEVAYLDHQLGRLLDFLRGRGLLETTVIAVVADHGENLGEHGIDYRHGGLFETTTRVPLLVRSPGEAPRGRRLPGLVETIDLFPTLLAGAGLAAPAVDGRELSQWAGEGKRGRPAAFAEHATQQGLTVRTREFRYTKSAGNPFLADGPYLFDLESDPLETTNLAGTGLEIEARLEELLRRWLADRREGMAAPEGVLSEEEIRRLKALGYL